MASVGLGELLVIGVILGVLLVGAVVVIAVARSFASGTASLGIPQPVLPAQRLASAVVQAGVPAELRCAATGPHEHGIWLDYAVTSGPSTTWSADVVLEWQAPPLAHAQRFVIGYDSDDHLTPPGVVGVTYVPTPGSSPPNTDDGALKLGQIRGAAPGAPVSVRCTITPTSPISRASFELRVSV